MGLKEKRVHGTPDFPIQVYIADKYHSRYEMACHWHMEYEILRVTKGVLHIFLNERKYIVGEGDIIFISAGILHSALPQGEECKYECIVFNAYYLMAQDDVCSSYIKNVLDYSIIIKEHYPAGTYTSLHNAVDELYEDLSRSLYGYQLSVKGHIYRFLGIVYREGLYSDNASAKTLSEKKIARLKDVLDFVDEYYDTPITLEMMANKAKMTPKYFCTYFKEITNKTPMEYLINYRIAHACILLHNSNLPITEIAYECGFGDLSYFIRTFKKIKNFTPGKYRDKINAGQKSSSISM